MNREPKVEIVVLKGDDDEDPRMEEVFKSDPKEAIAQWDVDKLIGVTKETLRKSDLWSFESFCLRLTWAIMDARCVDRGMEREVAETLARATYAEELIEERRKLRIAERQKSEADAAARFAKFLLEEEALKRQGKKGLKRLGKKGAKPVEEETPKKMIFLVLSS